MGSDPQGLTPFAQIEPLNVSPTHEYGPDSATGAIISRTARGGPY
jgi:hypothetical protein